VFPAIVTPAGFFTARACLRRSRSSTNSPLQTMVRGFLVLASIPRSLIVLSDTLDHDSDLISPHRIPVKKANRQKSRKF